MWDDLLREVRSHAFHGSSLARGPCGCHAHVHGIL